MAEYRPIKTKIWNDNWFLSLTPEEKSVWFFLLTNQNVHISGIYELPITLISPLVGSLRGEEILQKFERDSKIIYKDGWIYIKNYLKNQTQQINKKDNIIKSITLYLKENSHLVNLFNLPLEAPYKPLISPLGKGLKDERMKGLKKKDTVVSEKIASDLEPFNSNNYITNLMANDKNKHIRLIGQYFKIKKMVFPTKESIGDAIRRNSRAASKLIVYSSKAIEKTINSLERKKLDWTLETILNHIPKFNN